MCLQGMPCNLVAIKPTTGALTLRPGNAGRIHSWAGHHRKLDSHCSWITHIYSFGPNLILTFEPVIVQYKLHTFSFAQILILAFVTNCSVWEMMFLSTEFCIGK